MGPIIMLDKSAFQSLSGEEHTWLERYFLECLTPMLIVEIFGDLAKQQKRGSPPSKTVRDLTSKFGGSGPPVCTDFRSLCLGSLAGCEPPMDGRIPVSHGHEYRTRDGQLGLYLDLHPLNQSILRWQDGEFTGEELALAHEWRSLTRDFDRESFRSILDRRFVIVPTAGTPGDVIRVADSLVSSSGLQDVWFELLLSQLQPSSAYVNEISERWSRRPRFLLREHAPFAYHCIRSMLVLHVAERGGVTRWDRSHIRDMQYFFYLPFCMVFCSSDNVHQTLGPMLMREDQMFISGDTLKADLRRIAARWNAMSEHERKKAEFAYGVYPLPTPGSVVCEAWEKHGATWRAPSKGGVPDLSESDRSDAVREAEALYAEFRRSRGS